MSFLFYMFLGLRGFIYVNLIGIIPFWILCTYLFNWFVINGNQLVWQCGNLNVISSIDKVAFKLCFNKLSFSFGYLTLTIGLFVLMYSIFYFRGEPTAERLPFLLMLFVNSMLLLIFSDHMIVTFIGWEMIGVTSFFLINYWNSRMDTLKSAKKALVFNLLSDAFILMVLVSIFNITNELDISVINSIIYKHTDSVTYFGFIRVPQLSVISVTLALACSIKSAQFIFHAWLPDSMEAPAPASALIHSATLVSAGIYLLVKMYPLWSDTCLPYLPAFYTKDFIMLWGALTAAYGGVVSASQTDLKKILAYSTVSHCGYMMVLVGCGELNYLIFYFYIHGMYKALLFLVTGNIMRFYQTQDFRKMGNLWYNLHFECAVCITGFAQLSGAPFSLGFVAKHSILDQIKTGTLVGDIEYILILIGACASVVYSLEFIRCVWFDPNKSSKSIAKLYRDDKLFSKFNNPTGNIGLLVLTTYFIFSCLFGLYLELVLINSVPLDVSIDFTNFTQPVRITSSRPIYGYQQYMLSIVTVYSILTTTLVYVLISELEERITGETVEWIVWVLFIMCSFKVVYLLCSNPLHIVLNSMDKFIPSIFINSVLDAITNLLLFVKTSLSYLIEFKNYLFSDSTSWGLTEPTVIEYFIIALLGN